MGEAVPGKTDHGHNRVEGGKQIGALTVEAPSLKRTRGRTGPLLLISGPLESPPTRPAKYQPRTISSLSDPRPSRQGVDMRRMPDGIG